MDLIQKMLILDLSMCERAPENEYIHSSRETHRNKMNPHEVEDKSNRNRVRKSHFDVISDLLVQIHVKYLVDRPI